MVDQFFARLPRPLWLGLAGTILISLGSFGAGATRNRGGALEALNLEFLAWGHGGGLSSAVLWAGIVLLLLGWVGLGRDTVVDRAPADPVRSVLGHTLVWLIPLLAAAPILSRDVYSYLMQGAMTRDGFDAYSEGAAVNPGPFLLEVSHDWRNTTTPYGPLHLWLGEGVTTLVGDNVATGIIAYKVISVLGYLAIAWSVPRIAQRLGQDPVLATWLGVTNPVMMLHLVGGMHNESIMVGLVCLGLVACLDRRFVLGTVLIAVAVALKATAAIALPFVVWMAMNRYAGEGAALGRRVLAFLVSGVVGVALTLGTVGLITWVSGSSWGWLAEISGNSKVINPLAGPTLATETILPFIQLFFPDFDYNVVLGLTRTIGSVLMLAGLVVTWWLFRQDDRRAIQGIVIAYMVAFVFNSVTLPWYYASVIALVGTFHTSRALTQWATGASLFLAMAFAGSGNHQLYNTNWVIGTAAAAWVFTAWLFPLRNPGIVSPGAAETAKVRGPSTVYGG